MPTYLYKAMTKNGQEVKNKVEDSSRHSLIKKLKRNGLTPISISQTNIGGANKKSQRKNQKKNMSEAEGMIKKVSTSSAQSKKR